MNRNRFNRIRPLHKHRIFLHITPKGAFKEFTAHALVKRLLAAPEFKEFLHGARFIEARKPSRFLFTKEPFGQVQAFRRKFFQIHPNLQAATGAALAIGTHAVALGMRPVHVKVELRELGARILLGLAKVGRTHGAARILRQKPKNHRTVIRFLGKPSQVDYPQRSFDIEPMDFIFTHNTFNPKIISTLGA